MKHEKIANPSGQYEMSFEEIPEKKLEAQPELKDLDWGNYSEETLKAQKEEERKLREVREDIQKTEEEKKKIEELYDDGGIPDGSFEYKRYNKFIEEPKSRILTEKEKKEEDRRIAKIVSERERKEELRRRKQWDDYWAK